MLKKKAIKRSKWIAAGMYVLLGIFAGYVMGWVYGRESFGCSSSVAERLIRMGVFFLALYGSMVLHIFLHEVGHLFGGKASGYSLESFRVGSWIWAREEEGFCWKRFSLPGTVGQCLMAPPEPYTQDMPMLLYNLGGSAGNFLASLLALLLFFGREQGPVFSGFLLIFAGTGVVIGLLNVLPCASGAVDNDGHNAMTLRKNEAARRSFWLQLQMNKMISRGVRPKEMPQEWFVLPGEEELKETMGASVGVLCFMRLVDAMKFEEAQTLGWYLLDKAEGMWDLHRNLLGAEMLFCEIVTKGRRDQVEALWTQELKKAMKVLHHQPSMQRVAYACALLVDQEEEEAQKHLEAFEKIAKTYPYACSIQGERELLAYAQKIYQDIQRRKLPQGCEGENKPQWPMADPVQESGKLAQGREGDGAQEEGGEV